MITKEMWKTIIVELAEKPIDYCIGMMAVIVAIVLDLAILPFEIIGLIVYKICNKR